KHTKKGSKLDVVNEDIDENLETGTSAGKSGSKGADADADAGDSITLTSREGAGDEDDAVTDAGKVQRRASRHHEEDHANDVDGTGKKGDPDAISLKKVEE